MKSNCAKETGVFRPTEPVELAEGSQVQIEIATSSGASASIQRTPEQAAHVDRVYEILSRRYDGGARVAARHDEHQP
jgi:predicted DNA-binding antitoxin AbrB/MazE fold protein